MKVNIGKNTLGDSDKMSLSIKEYGRSTHDLSYAWRSTMGVGVLVPFMKILALPGDTFEIDLENKVLTQPTLGPLFGSFKFQADVFTCPIRLYNAMLHNNALKIGLNMKNVKLPQIKLEQAKTETGDAKDNIKSSSLQRYLGTFILFDGTNREINAIPTLAYYDIFKNYYANKQEGKFPMYSGVERINEGTVATSSIEKVNEKYVVKIEVKASTKENFENSKIKVLFKSGKKREIKGNELFVGGNGGISENNGTFTFIKYVNDMTGGNGVKFSQITLNPPSDSEEILKEPNWAETISGNISVRKIEDFNLEEIDELRELILSKGRNQLIIDKNINIPFLRASISQETRKEHFGGLCLKTYQSDLFNNWINSESIESDNGIAKITAIDTSSGSFNIDTFNLAKKVYEMLNRIALSGGTYKDWIETVYTTDYYFRAETPVYEGGMSSEIEFEPITSYSASTADEYEPLGTLAGRGINTQKKGGKITIKVNEPCYIMGICSITPRVDYYRGDDWDNDLKSLDEIHKPQLDGIGYEDLLLRYIDGAQYRGNEAIGKQPAWIKYTTNVNRTYADFAGDEPLDYMVLNKAGDYKTSYIKTPELYNRIFAATGNQERNFWVQIGCKIEARRVMSARQIPNF